LQDCSSGTPHDVPPYAAAFARWLNFLILFDDAPIVFVREKLITKAERGQANLLLTTTILPWISDA
jgi:hypothetical protein